MTRSRSLVALFALMTGALGTAAAATRSATLKPPSVSLLSEQEATKSGANIIRGDTYGESLMDARQAIKAAELRMNGTRECGPVNSPVWALHVHAGTGERPLDGWIYLDAATGALQCSRLPFVD